MLGPVTMTTYMELWVVPPQANVLYPIYSYNYLDTQHWSGRQLFRWWGFDLRNRSID